MLPACSFPGSRPVGTSIVYKLILTTLASILSLIWISSPKGLLENYGALSWVLLPGCRVVSPQLCWSVCHGFVKESTFTELTCPSYPYLFPGFSRKPSCAHRFQDHVVKGCHWGRVVEHLASQHWAASHRPRSHALCVWVAEPWTNYPPVLDFSLFIGGMRPRLTFSASQQGLSGISIHSKFSGTEEGILVASVCQRVISLIKYFPAVCGQSYLKSLITTGI